MIRSDIPGDADIKYNAPDVKKIMTVSIKIEELLSGSYLESEDLFDSIKDDLIILGFEEETQKIAEHITNFDYKDAKKILAVLKDKLKNKTGIR